MFIELVRASVNNGKLTRVLSDISTDEGENDVTTVSIKELAYLYLHQAMPITTNT